MSLQAVEEAEVSERSHNGRKVAHLFRPLDAAGDFEPSGPVIRLQLDGLYERVYC